jgi:Tol biopolymer transport system component
MRSDGTGLTPLGGAGNNSDASWSGDDAQIAFHSDRDGNDELYVMDADGFNPTRLTNQPASG